MHFVFGSSMGKTKNFKGRSSNVERYLNSCGREIDISGLIAPNLAAGARLAAKNESSSLDEKTARTYELRLIALETFAAQNGDDAVLFGPNKRPFLAATLQTFMRKYYFSQCNDLSNNSRRKLRQNRLWMTMRLRVKFLFDAPVVKVKFRFYTVFNWMTFVQRRPDFHHIQLRFVTTVCTINAKPG